jgi:hypothetical protein
MAQNRLPDLEYSSHKHPKLMFAKLLRRLWYGSNHGIEHTLVYYLSHVLKDYPGVLSGSEGAPCSLDRSNSVEKA